MLATILHKHTARRVVHTAVNVANSGGSMRNNGKSLLHVYMSDNLPAVADTCEHYKHLESKRLLGATIYVYFVNTFSKWHNFSKNK